MFYKCLPLLGTFCENDPRVVSLSMQLIEGNKQLFAQTMCTAPEAGGSRLLEGHIFSYCMSLQIYFHDQHHFTERFVCQASSNGKIIRS